jgi:hypothetical protein
VQAWLNTASSLGGGEASASKQQQEQCAAAPPTPGHEFAEYYEPEVSAPIGRPCSRLLVRRTRVRIYGWCEFMGGERAVGLCATVLVVGSGWCVVMHDWVVSNTLDDLG